MSLSHYADYFDFCFHPSTLKAFRQWLRTVYGTLAALNAEWGTAYTAWDDAMPMSYDEAKDAENPAPWGDFRTYMEKATSDFLALVQSTAAEMDPGSRISLSGTQSPVAGNGMDWWRMSRAVPIYHSYDTSNMFQARRSFSPWQCDEPWFAGYWKEGSKLEKDMWRCLFHNGSGVSAWYTPIFFFPDMTYTVSGRQIREHWRELSGGIWQQVRALRIEPPKVAVHYSQASIHATFLEGTPERVHKAWEGWLRSLEDLAVPYDFVAYEEVEKGVLTERGYRVLILPCSVALSDAETAAVSAFAAAGNTVIADIFPGRRNEHCRAVDREELNRLFGVAYTGPAGKDSVGATFADRVALPTLAVADRLDAHGARAEGRSASGDIPLLNRHTVGQGQAVLLNFGVSFYDTARRVGREPERVWRRLLGELLSRAGVTPSVRMTCKDGAQPHIATFRYLDRNGRPLLYGFLNSVLPGAEPQYVEIELTGRRDGHVFDLRSGRKVAAAPRIAGVFKPGEPKLFAVLDRPNATVDVADVAADRGMAATVNVEVAVSAFDQVLRCEVIDARGKAREEYSGVVTATGDTGTLRVPLAINDPAGDWTVRVTHIVTGTCATGTITVR